MQGCQGLLVVPETERLQPRIDQPFRLGLDSWVFGGAVTDLFHLAVHTDNTAIRGDFLHLCLADADMSKDRRPCHRRLHRCRHVLDGAMEEFEVQRGRGARTASISFCASMSAKGALCGCTDCTATRSGVVWAARAMATRNAWWASLRMPHQSTAQSTTGEEGPSKTTPSAAAGRPRLGPARSSRRTTDGRSAE